MYEFSHLDAHPAIRLNDLEVNWQGASSKLFCLNNPPLVTRCMNAKTCQVLMNLTFTPLLSGCIQAKIKSGDKEETRVP